MRKLSFLVAAVAVAGMAFADYYAGEAAELRAWTLKHLSAGRAVTFNVLIDRNGRLNPAFAALKDVLRQCQFMASKMRTQDDDFAFGGGDRRRRAGASRAP